MQAIMSDSGGTNTTQILMITAAIVFLGGILFLIIFRLYALHCRRHEAEMFLGDRNPAEMRDRGTYLRRLFVGMFVDHVPDLHRAGQSTPSAEEEKVGFGLAASVVKKLPTFTFKRGSARFDSRENSECPVCLDEFSEGEKGRILRQCGHCFHAECLDMWFFSHTTCPICRSEVKNFDEAVQDTSPAPESSRSINIANIAENSLLFSGCPSDGMGPSQSQAYGKMPTPRAGSRGSSRAGSRVSSQRFIDVEFGERAGSRGSSRAGSRVSSQRFNDVELGERAGSRAASRVSSQRFVDVELGENGGDPQIRETADRQPSEDVRIEAHPSNITGQSHNNSPERVEDGSDNHV